MKKIILNIVFVFAAGPFLMNAKTNQTIAEDCTKDAWDYGTEAGEKDAVLEYEYTKQYFDLHCNLDGTYKDQAVFSEGQ